MAKIDSIKSLIWTSFQEYKNYSIRFFKGKGFRNYDSSLNCWVFMLPHEVALELYVFIKNHFNKNLVEDKYHQKLAEYSFWSNIVTWVSLTEG